MRKKNGKRLRNDTLRWSNGGMYSSSSRAGFSLLELLTVMAIVSVLTAVTMVTFRGTRSAGARQGTADLLMQSVEQARQTAIASGAKAYVGIADKTYPDSKKRLRAYILFREYTDGDVDEIKAAGGAAPASWANTNPSRNGNICREDFVLIRTMWIRSCRMLQRN